MAEPVLIPHRPAHLRVPDYGVGAGLRVPHYAYLKQHEPAMGFFEVISENFFGDGGRPLHHLDLFRERYPLVLHGVALSIGSPDELDVTYLKKLKKLVDRVKPAWVTDHLCFTGAGGAHLHDLLPLPYTDEVVERVAARVARVQDYLEVPFGLENTSSYLTYRASTMTEWEFVSRIAERADCGLLFDVNNVYVSAYNHGFDPLEFVRHVPHERILQIHVAGHTNRGKYIIDTHRGPVSADVTAIYRETIRRAGAISTLLEWDDRIPEFPELATEVARLAAVRDEALAPDCPELTRLEMQRPDENTTNTRDAWVQGGPSDHFAEYGEEPRDAVHLREVGE